MKRFCAVFLGTLLVAQVLGQSFLPKEQAQSFLETWNILNQGGEFNSFKNHDEAGQIHDVLTLLLQSGGSFDEVISLLRKLKLNIEGELSTLTMNYNTEKGKAEENLRETRQKGLRSENEYKASSVEVKDLEVKITNLRSGLHHIKKQIVILRNQSNILEDARISDDKEFATRLGEQRESYAILGSIINDLTTKVLASESNIMIQKPQLRIPKVRDPSHNSNNNEKQNLRRNALFSLIDMSAGFDPETVKMIVGRMTALKKDIEETMNEDEASRAKSVETYNVLVKRMREQLDSLVQNEANMDSELKRSKKNIVIARESIELNHKLMDLSEVKVKNIEAELDTLTKNYNKESARLSSILSEIKKAIDTLKSTKK